ncbi:MAG TPA: zinc ribbon domain-containing protein, partial [Anaerolineales bacterium]|nr:zinc ribbon domain-containing protein [Anaerolineales bacterium]
MPTYDFICNSCQKRFDIFMTFSEYGQKTVQCVHCDSEDVRRRMTKVRIAKSTESRMESMEGDLTSMADLEDNPRALGQMMKKM